MYKLLIVILLLTAGCTAVGPDYNKPDLDPPKSWHQVSDPALLPDKTKIRKWWTVFNDPTLNMLIQNATKQNLDLKVAVATVEEARAQLGVARGDYLPSITAEGSGTREESRGTQMNSDGILDTYYSTGTDVSWELDLFGRIKRSVQAATAEFQATEEDRVDVMISLYAQVASTYINVRTLQARLKTALENIRSQKEILELTKSRFKHGLATDLDVAQAEQVLANTKSEVPPLRIQLIEEKNNLSTLLGRPPSSLGKILKHSKPIPMPPDKITTGVPADLLRQRPDLRGAERRLAAQTARIGMTKAELYPILSLTGNLNYKNTELHDMFVPGTRAFSFGPFLSWNIFNSGKIREQIKVEDARARQALFIYEQTLLTALSEVEDAMTGYIEQQTRLKALKDSVQASTRYLHLAEKLYKDGLSDFQNVLDAQRELFLAEDNLDKAKGNSAQYIVTLYKALGGGWDPETRKSGVYAMEKKGKEKIEKTIKGDQG